MGGEGIAIIVALAFVVFSVIPTINRRIAIISRTMLDERFAPDLRILNTQPRSEENSHLRELNLNHETAAHCSKIYYSERKMGSKDDSPIREAARARAMAKVRIRKRRSTERKIFCFSLMLILVTIILWLAVPVAHISVSYGIVGILFSSLSVTVFVHTRKNNLEANRADLEKIAKTAGKTGFVPRRANAHKTQTNFGKTVPNLRVCKIQEAQKRSENFEAQTGWKKQNGFEPDGVKTGNNKPGAQTEAKSTHTRNNPADLYDQENRAVRETNAIQETNPAGTVNTLSTVNETVRVKKITALQTDTQAGATANIKQRAQNNALQKNPATRLNMPSYTAKPKIQKRKVVPYTPVTDTASEKATNVPYRPRRIGERITDKEFATPNPAPQMTGKEELRSDLLGSGSALDALLDRRRA